MSASEQLIKAVRSVLHTKEREGRTAKRDVTILVMRKIDRAGGPTKFGIGAAAMRMAFQSLVEDEVSRQMKMGLTDHEYKFMLPASTPMEIIASLGRAPRWLSINDGSEANWVFALQATPEEWVLNSALKEKKAEQTRRKADESLDIARFLALNGFRSLSEVLATGV